MKGIIKDDTVRNPVYIESIIEKRIQGIDCCWGTCNIVVVEETHYCVEHSPMELKRQASQADQVRQLFYIIQPSIHSTIIPTILNTEQRSCFIWLDIRLNKWLYFIYFIFF